MAFHVWDNLAGCYLHSKSTGDRATFPSRHEAEAAIQKFISRRTVKDDWLNRLDVEDHEANLLYHLSGPFGEGPNTYFQPVLLPLNFRVPASHWKLLNEDGLELQIGSFVKSFRDETVELIAATPPRFAFSDGEVTCVDHLDRKNWWRPSVICAKFEYRPPETDSNARD